RGKPDERHGGRYANLYRRADSASQEMNTCKDAGRLDEAAEHDARGRIRGRCERIVARADINITAPPHPMPHALIVNALRKNGILGELIPYGGMAPDLFVRTAPEQHE